MPDAPLDSVTLTYEAFGDAGHPALLLIAGLGQQLIAWEEALCELLADRGLLVIRFDNRDAGLSTHLDHAGKISFRRLIPAIKAGATPSVPYSLDDMAGDAVGLLDHLEIDASHIVGMSMGGMIAQLIALNHPDRVLSLTSIMSTTGDSSVGRGTREAMRHLYAAPPADRERAVAAGVAAASVIASPEHFDETAAAARTAAAYDRAFDPAGIGRQLAAILTAPDRTEQLRHLRMPTLVIHGSEDPLIHHNGGIATAEAVPGATVVTIPGMGHDLPEAFWPQLVYAIATHVRSAAT